MADRISLRLRRNDMNVFRTIDEPGQKRQAHGYRTWAGFRGQILWAFGEAVDPDTGEIKPLRSVPRGLGGVPYAV